MSNKNNGFTILELLVVTALIAMIGSLAFVQVSKARVKARDTEREKEIKTIQDALAIYAINNRRYPPYVGAITGGDPASQALINDGALQAMPRDPINQDEYHYDYSAPDDGSTYVIVYYLESDSILGKDSGQQQATP